MGVLHILNIYVDIEFQEFINGFRVNFHNVSRG